LFGFCDDALSRLTQMTQPNGPAMNYSFNNPSRLPEKKTSVGDVKLTGALFVNRRLD
jgi:hypothetical protein